MEPHDRVVVVGGAIAGWSCVAELRRLGFRGRIDVVSREDALPYERPPLSKKFLTGEWDEARLLVATRVADDDGPVVLHPHDPATALDTTNHEILLASGTRLPYTHAVIAAGAQPRVPEGLGGEGVHVLRTREDAVALRAAVRRNRRLCIVGGGFIGLEVAASCRSMGAAVTVIEPYPAGLAARVGAVAAQRLVDRHRSEGVELRWHCAPAPVGALDGDGGLRLDSGEVLERQPILAATGAMPSTGWLAGSGLDIDDGVQCDEFGQAAPGVWAAGDAARWYHPLYRQPLRVEHRLNAAEQGRLVARNMLGAAAPWAEIPFFWTDQYGIRLQVVGRIGPEHRAQSLEGEADGHSFLTVFAHESQPPAIVAWNAAARLTALRRELGLVPSAPADTVRSTPISHARTGSAS